MPVPYLTWIRLVSKKGEKTILCICGVIIIPANEQIIQGTVKCAPNTYPVLFSHFFQHGNTNNTRHEKKKYRRKLFSPVTSFRKENARGLPILKSDKDQVNGRKIFGLYLFRNSFALSCLSSWISFLRWWSGLRSIFTFSPFLQRKKIKTFSFLFGDGGDLFVREEPEKYKRNIRGWIRKSEIDRFLLSIHSFMHSLLTLPPFLIFLWNGEGKKRSDSCFTCVLHSFSRKGGMLEGRRRNGKWGRNYRKEGIRKKGKVSFATCISLPPLLWCVRPVKCKKGIASAQGNNGHPFLCLPRILFFHS